MATTLESRWGLSFHPFEGAEARRRIVSIEPQRRAIAELRSTIARAERLVRVVGAAGVGKTTVVQQVLAEHRGPHCRTARIAGAFDAAELFGRLADALRRERTAQPGHEDAATAWRRLTDAVRLCRVQELALVLAVDEAGPNLDTSAFDRLARLDSAGTFDVTVLVVGGRLESEELDPSRAATIVAVPALTRGEAWDYLNAKIEAAGGPREFWSREAATRLHAEGRGLPREIDRLASRALQSALEGGPLAIAEPVLAVALPCPARW